MAITYGKDKTATQKAADVKKRLGPSMNGANPGKKPPAKIKPVIKPKKNGIYVGGKITF